MTGTVMPAGNIKRCNMYQLTLSPTAVTANTTSPQTFTFVGLTTTDWVDAQYVSTQQTGLSVSNTRVSATNTLEITFSNNTGSTITPTAGGQYLLIHFYSDVQPLQTAV